MNLFARLRMWWYRRNMHYDCELELVVWCELGLHVPHGACVKCLPRMEWMREQLITKASSLP